MIDHCWSTTKLRSSTNRLNSKPILFRNSYHLSPKRNMMRVGQHTLYIPAEPPLTISKWSLAASTVSNLRKASDLERNLISADRSSSIESENGQSVTTHEKPRPHSSRRPYSASLQNSHRAPPSKAYTQVCQMRQWEAALIGEGGDNSSFAFTGAREDRAALELERFLQPSSKTTKPSFALCFALPCFALVLLCKAKSTVCLSFYSFSFRVSAFYFLSAVK